MTMLTLARGIGVWYRKTQIFVTKFTFQGAILLFCIMLYSSGKSSTVKKLVLFQTCQSVKNLSLTFYIGGVGWPLVYVIMEGG